jgi:nucleoside-diphosphate-sugar epimerase
MEILIAGGHGQIALRLLRRLAARGDRGRGLIRDPDHARDVEEAGGEPVVCDLESDDPRPHLGGADAIVFAAGAGPGSGPERKQTVDLGGAVKLIDTAKANDIRRYLIVSSMGAGNPPPGDEGFAVYLQAKAAADEALASSGLEFTIVRPGMLTDAPGSGRIEAAEDLGRRGEIPRDDVAATLVAALGEPATIGKTFEILGGEQEIAAALRSI